MEKIIIDCHNHSKWSRFNRYIKWSDGFDYVEDFASVAIEQNITMCAISEHDTVNRELKKILKDSSVLVPEAVEISAKNYARDKALHILYYADIISTKVDNLLENVLNQKKQMLFLQILKLQEFWFDVNFDDIFEYIKQNWHWEDWMNKWEISKYLFEWKNRDFNTIIFYNLFKNINLEDEKIYRWFYNNCMKSGWEFYEQYRVETPNYEPDINIVWELAKEDNAVLSIAHPNFTFKKWVEEFKRELPYYLDAWVNAIEFNAKVDYAWGKAIMEVKEKYDLILTFGSDCHMIWWNDDKHATFWTASPFITQEILEENLEKFRNKIWI